MTAIFMGGSSKKKRALIVRFTGRLNKRPASFPSGELQFQLQWVPCDTWGESRKIDAASLNTSTMPVTSAATGIARHSAPSMGPTSTTDAKPSTTVTQRAHCRRNATHRYKPPINARDAISAAMGSPGPVISASPVSAHESAYARPRHTSAVESACSRHCAPTPCVCCNASFEHVSVVFMPAPAAWFFDASRCIRLIGGSLDARVVPDQMEVGNIACSMTEAYVQSLCGDACSRDLPDESPHCFWQFRRGHRRNKAKSSNTTLRDCKDAASHSSLYTDHHRPGVRHDHDETEGTASAFASRGRRRRPCRGRYLSRQRSALDRR